MIETALNCARGECRSPYACASIVRCADALTPEQDRREFGYGNIGGKYGADAEPPFKWCQRRQRKGART